MSEIKAALAAEGAGFGSSDSKSDSSPADAAEFRLEGALHYDRRGPRRWILSHLRRHPQYGIIFLLATLSVSSIRAFQPRLIGRAFDLVAGAAGPVDLVPSLAGPLVAPLVGLGQLAFLVLGLVILQGLLELASDYSMEVLGQRLERDARDELYLSLLGKSQTFHDRQRVGDIMARAANDVRQLNPMMSPGVFLIVDSFLSLIIPIIAIGLIDPRLLAAPLIFTAFFLVALRRYSAALNPVSGLQRMRFGQMNAGLAETIGGIEVVKASAQEPAERGKFEASARAFRDAFVEQGMIQARYIPMLLIAVALAGAFLHGVTLVGRGELTVGELIAYMGLMNILRYPTFISIFTFSLVQMGVAGAGRILELLRTETELDENPEGHAAPMAGEIVFDNVRFGYGEQPVLEGIRFRAAPGETVAIVGQAGSGKTTLAHLVSRIYDVQAGAVKVDGVDVRDWQMASLRSQISVIEQDVFLFSRPVAENIAFGLGQQSDPAAIERAAREAQAHGFIMELPEGYATIIGERGTTLSGGQRQRLAIARALLTDPRILIIDDSTSAIDSATEDLIQGAIGRVMQGRTTLLITHRLSQIRRADRILILERGRLVDQGRHEELLERSEHYRRIFARRDARSTVSSNARPTKQDKPMGNGQAQDPEDRG
jgi:ATP-binding cassette subfamily B protein